MSKYTVVFTVEFPEGDYEPWFEEVEADSIEEAEDKALAIIDPDLDEFSARVIDVEVST